MKSLKVSLRIIGLFGVAIMVSKIPDVYPDFFGDWYCEGSKRVASELTYTRYEFIGCDYGFEESIHNPMWHWGYQHYLFFLMGLSLAGVQVVDIFNLINKED